MNTWTIICVISEYENPSEKEVWNYIKELGYQTYTLNDKITFHFLVDDPINCTLIRWSTNNVEKTIVRHKGKHIKNSIITDSRHITCKSENIHNFISYARNRDPAKQYAFFYCGGGFGVYTENQTRCPTSILKWKKMLDKPEWCEHRKYTWNLIAFDCCLMSTLETCSEFAQTTPYILGCQTYEPYQGTFSLDMVKAFEKHTNIPFIGKSIIDSFIFRVNNFHPVEKKFDRTQVFPDPADMSLIDTRNIPLLVQSLSKFLVPRKIRNDQGRVFSKDSENGYFDLVTYLSSLANASVAPTVELLTKIICYYKQSNRLKYGDAKNIGKMLNGLSFCGSSKLDKYTRSIYHKLAAPKSIPWLGSLDIKKEPMVL